MTERKSSDARIRANKKYHKKTYKTFTVNAKIADYEMISKYCEQKNISKASLLLTAAKYFIEHDIQLDKPESNDE